MSFERRTPATTTTAAAASDAPAVRISTEPLQFLTGVPSLDDVLGGGIRSGHSFLALTPDAHSSYGDLLQKYFIAQGLQDGGQTVLVFAERALVDSCMWLARDPLAADASVAESKSDTGKITIAWRYEAVGQHQTTVDASLFDLSTRIPEQIVTAAIQNGSLRIQVPSLGPRSLDAALDLIHYELRESTNKPLRISLPSLGSFHWGDTTLFDLCRFLRALRSLLKASARPASAYVTLPANLCTEQSGDPCWLDKLGWLVDGCVAFNAFSADPALTATFPTYHGMLRIYTLPTATTFTPTSDRTSLLRGLYASASHEMGLSENNLGFKTTRKKLLIETLHLDVEGGVSERRTTPATLVEAPAKTQGGPKVEIVAAGSPSVPLAATAEVAQKRTKPKKSVGFVSDKPDLYDF